MLSQSRQWNVSSLNFDEFDQQQKILTVGVLIDFIFICK